MARGWGDPRLLYERAQSKQRDHDAFSADPYTGRPARHSSMHRKHAWTRAGTGRGGGHAPPSHHDLVLPPDHAPQQQQLVHDSYSRSPATRRGLTWDEWMHCKHLASEFDAIGRRDSRDAVTQTAAAMQQRQVAAMDGWRKWFAADQQKRRHRQRLTEAQAKVENENAALVAAPLEEMRGRPHTCSRRRQRQQHRQHQQQQQQQQHAEAAMNRDDESVWRRRRADSIKGWHARKRRERQDVRTATERRLEAAEERKLSDAEHQFHRRFLGVNRPTAYQVLESVQEVVLERESGRYHREVEAHLVEVEALLGTTQITF